MFRKRFLAFAVLLSLLSGYPVHSQSDPDTKPTTFYSGTVTDAAGEPVADATVFSTYYAAVAVGEPRPIKSQATTDSDGQFQIPIYGKAQHTICVYAKGHALWVKQFNNRYGPGSPKGNVIQLQKPKSVEVSIAGTDGKPATIESAKLEFFVSENEAFSFGAYGDLPVPIQIENGRMVINWLPKDGNGSIEVRCKDHVSQMVNLEKDGETKRSAQLRPAANLSGTVTSAGQPVPNSLVKIRVSAKRPNDSMCPVSRSAGVRTDADGKYECELIEGTASLTCYDGRTGSRGESKSVELKAGEAVQQDIKFESLVTVRGRVVNEEGTGIEGVHIGRRGAVTNMAGHYEFEAEPKNTVWIHVSKIPDGYGDPANSQFSVQLKAGETTHEVKDIVLPFSFPLSGTVVDSEGKPVEGASVVSGWRIRTGLAIRDSGDTESTDNDGRFTFGKAPKEDIAIYAFTNDCASPKTIVVDKSADRDNVQLVIQDDALMKLSGKISSTDGIPIKGANIVVLERQGIPWINYGDHYLGRPLGECQTSDDGSFEFPISLYRCKFYGCKISAPGYVGKKVTSLTIPESGNPTDLVDFRLPPTRSLRGKVVDSKGTAVAGVNVWSHHFVEPKQFGRQQVDYRNHEGNSAKTDSEGKFELTGVHDQSSFVFADKDGYHITGVLIRDGAEENNLTIISESEPGEKLKFTTFAAEDRKIWVNEVIDFAKQVSGKKLSRFASRQVLDLLLLVDRERIETMLEGMDWGMEKATMHAALGHHEEALETALAYENPTTRVRILALCAARTEDPRQRAVLLTEAAFQLSNVANIGSKVSMSSSIIDDLLDLGEVETATELANLLTPAALAIDGTGRNEFTKAWFAKALVRVDYDSAWELIKDSIDSKNPTSGGFQRHAGNMAHELAAENPDQAIELLNKIPGNRGSSYVPRVACRMASVDPERALKLLQSVPDSGGRYKINGQATLAFIIKDSHPEKAKELMGSAFDDLFKSFPRSDYRMGVILNLLRFESQVCDGGSKNFWKIVEQLSDPNVSQGNSRYSDKLLIRQSELALLLAIFDREPEARERLCAILIDRFENPRDDDPIFRSQRDNGIAMAAVALHDPRRAIDMVKTFHEKTPEKRRRNIPIPWTIVAGCLARDGNETVDFLATEFLFTWILGEED